MQQSLLVCIPTRTHLETSSTNMPQNDCCFLGQDMANAVNFLSAAEDIYGSRLWPTILRRRNAYRTVSQPHMFRFSLTNAANTIKKDHSNSNVKDSAIGRVGSHPTGVRYFQSLSRVADFTKLPAMETHRDERC